MGITTINSSERLDIDYTSVPFYVYWNVIILSFSQKSRCLYTLIFQCGSGIILIVCLKW